MKEGWEVKKLGEVCEINYGTRVVQKKDGGTIYPVYGGGGATFKMDRYNREDCVVVARFAMSNQCVRYVQGKFFLNDSGLSVRTKEEKLSQKYLDKCIFSLNDKIYSLGKGVAQKNLDMKGFRHLDINYPCSKDEQSRIVEELDQLSNIIEKKRQQLSELDNLAQSIFYDMFGDPVTNEKGWEMKKLKDITSKIGSGATPKGGNESYKDEGVSLIRSLNVYNNSFKYKDLAHIDDEQASALNNVIVEIGDVLLNITGASVARCCIVPMDVLPARVNQHVSIIRGKDVINNSFLNYLLTSNAYQSLLIMLSKSNGATREALTKGQLESLKIILPPLTFQQLFAQKIEVIEKEKELIKQSIEKTDILYLSRMNLYFK